MMISRASRSFKEGFRTVPRVHSSVSHGVILNFSEILGGGGGGGAVMRFQRI